MPSEEAGIDPSQPLYLQRNNKHKQDLHIREKECSHKDHGETDIIYGGIADQKAQKDIEDHTDEKVTVKPGGAPLPLQYTAKPVKEIGFQNCDNERSVGNGESKKTKVTGHGDKNKGNEPPNFSSQNEIAGKEQGCGKRTGTELVKKTNRYIADSDIEHQIMDAKVGVIPTESVDFVFNPPQGKDLLQKAYNRIVPAFGANVKKRKYEPFSETVWILNNL